MLKGRKEKFRKARRLKGRRGEREKGKVSHVRLIGKLNPKTFIDCQHN